MKAGTYRPAEGEGYDESGVGLVRLNEGERIASQDGAGRVAVSARTRNRHVALILLEAQSEMSGAFTLAAARTVLSSVSDAATALAISQTSVRILQCHHLQFEEPRRSGQLQGGKKRRENSTIHNRISFQVVVLGKSDQCHLNQYHNEEGKEEEEGKKKPSKYSSNKWKGKIDGRRLAGAFAGI